jgi:hypothetical protein
VSNNRLSKVDHLQGLTQLEDLWVNDNQIPSLEGIDEALQDQVGEVVKLTGCVATQISFLEGIDQALLDQLGHSARSCI